MTTVYKYRVHCISENIDVIVWDTTTPTICPNDHADRTIDTTKTTIIGTVSTQTFTVEEPTTGYFQHTTKKLTISSGTVGDVTSHDFTWPMDILIWKVEFNADTANEGDQFDVIINPANNSGALTANAVINDTVLNVPAALVNDENITKGVEITLDDTTNSQNVGRITAIDKVANTITVANALTFNFNSGVTIIYVNVCFVKERQIYKADDKIKIGEKGFKGKLVTANTIIRCNYTNNSTAAKTLYFDLEYYYS